MIINLSVENYKVKDRVVLNNFKLNIDKFNSTEDISKNAFIMINQLYYSFIIPESLKILYKILNNTYNFADQDLKIFSDPTKPIFISLYFTTNDPPHYYCYNVELLPEGIRYESLIEYNDVLGSTKDIYKVEYENLSIESKLTEVTEINPFSNIHFTDYPELLDSKHPLSYYLDTFNLLGFGHINNYNDSFFNEVKKLNLSISVEQLKNKGTIIFDHCFNLINYKLLKRILTVCNELNIQIIFVTNNTKILDHPYIQYDEIWLNEYNKLKNTFYFYSLVEIPDIHRYKNIEKSYLNGTFGGIPFIPHI